MYEWAGTTYTCYVVAANGVGAGANYLQASGTLQSVAADGTLVYLGCGVRHIRHGSRSNGGKK